MKQLMLGNDAVARGLYEAGVRYVSSYPGTPSTEITERVALYPEVYAEWAPNEKVALESALGASIAGARAFCGMKHVGLNVAADPLFTASYTGVGAGLVVCVADDPGMHSSQNEQDSRHYAEGAKLLMLEPADSGECRDFTAAAYELSERFDTPVLLRMATRIAHSQSLVEPKERMDDTLKPYEKNPAKYVMMPAYARGRHTVVEARERALREYVETTPLNRIEYHDKKLGVICAGASYMYCREALGESASYLKLGVVYPLPEKLIREFAANVDRLVVAEELDPVIERHVRALGVSCEGKSLFPMEGELSQTIVRRALGLPALPSAAYPEKIPPRPPVMCAGCPHRGLFYLLKKLGLTVFGDIGCYTLGAAAPLQAIDTVVCMGASISGMHGFLKARPEAANKTVAVIGDSTFMHSGLTGLADIVYNKGCGTVIIADNSITGMTGHQQNPTTGLTLQMEETTIVDIEAVCRGIGIKRLVVVDPNDLKAMEKALREETAAAEPSVIISRHPCALLKGVKHRAPFSVDSAACKSCRMCLKIGCPAIALRDGKAFIDPAQCVGCGLCTQLCPFGAIKEGD